MQFNLGGEKPKNQQPQTPRISLGPKNPEPEQPKQDPMDLPVAPSENKTVRPAMKSDRWVFDPTNIEYETAKVADDIEGEVDEEFQARVQKLKKSQKRKSTAILATLITFIVLILGNNAYLSFFKHEYTPNEIGQIAQQYKGETNFYSVGVPGYLIDHSQDILDQIVSVDSGLPPGSKYTAESVSMTNLFYQNSDTATVYANFKIKGPVTPEKEEEQTFDLPVLIVLRWNSEKVVYEQVGQASISSRAQTSSSTKPIQDDFMKFSGQTADASTTSEAQKFIENFLTVLYNGGDVSPYYKYAVPVAKPVGTSFVNMGQFVMYQEDNLGGYNVSALVTIKHESGVQMSSVVYFKVEKSGDSWIVTKMS